MIFVIISDLSDQVQLCNIVYYFNMATKSSKSSTKQWRRVLYEDQPYPDNHVSDEFLAEMTINKNVRLYGYWELVFSSVVITQQLCVVCLFILSWWYMGDKLVSPSSVLAVSLIFCIIGYLLLLTLYQFSFDKDRIFNDVKTVILLLGFTAFFSPVLETLTHTISTDTIYTMATIMFLGHFAFHDYSVDAAFASRAVSFNMSIFAAVCLASRLNAVYPTFVTIFLAFLLFGLWPPLRRSLWKQAPNLLHLVALVMYVLVFVGFLLVDVFNAVSFIVVLACISFALPALLLSLQSKKNNISGPWDEAVVQDAK